MDLTDPRVVQIIAVAAVSAIWPLVIALARRMYPALNDYAKYKKMLIAVVSTFAWAAAATPGTWKERCWAGFAAVVLSQSGYNVARTLKQ